MIKLSTKNYKTIYLGCNLYFWDEKSNCKRGNLETRSRGMHWDNFSKIYRYAMSAKKRILHKCIQLGFAIDMLIELGQGERLKMRYFTYHTWLIYHLLKAPNCILRVKSKYFKISSISSYLKSNIYHIRASNSVVVIE